MKKLLVLTLLLVIGPLTVIYGTEKEDSKTDSPIDACYARCRNHVRQPEVLAIADSLRHMAIEEGDLKMQGTAMIFVADYYYSQNNLDSLKTWMTRIEQFSRETDQLLFHYFTWDCLITFYTKAGQYTLAQYEIEKMLRQAEKDDYKFGVATAYYNLGTIYLLRGIEPTAVDYYRKAIHHILSNKLETYTLCTIYLQLATALCEIESYKEAFPALDEAEKHIADKDQKILIDDERAKVFAKMGNTEQAIKLLRYIEQNKPAYYLDEDLWTLRLRVYENSKMYPQALEAANALIENNRKLGYDQTNYIDLFESRAHIYAGMGNIEEAYREMMHFVNLYKKKISSEGESTLAEFATLLNVEQFEQTAQAERLSRTRSLVTALICILLLSAAFIIVQMRSNRHLRRAKRAAEEANRMKDDFIRNITHEVNTPLNAIMGFTELVISAPEDDPERQTYINILRQNSDYLQKLIDDTLYIADLGSQNEKHSKSATNIIDCCQHALRNISHLHKSGVEVVFKTDNQPLMASASAQYIIKMATELLRNALSFTDKGTIILSAAHTADSKQIILSVTDTGCGVPEIECERIFERFVKLNSFTQGMGLGLSVCRMIAQTMNGEVRLDTSYTEGARFEFIFPVTQPQKQRL